VMANIMFVGEVPGTDIADGAAVASATRAFLSR
jgi:hypothetical protein